VKETDLRAGGLENINHRFRPGLTLTVRELVELTLTESDNTAADLLLARIGTSAVNARLRELGIEGVDVSRSERELAVDSSGVVAPAKPVTLREFDRLVRAMPRKERQKARDRWEADPRDTSTPLAMARLLVRLQKGELLSKGSTDFVLDAMRRCKTGRNRIRAGVPAGTLVAEKTGTAERSANDVGIVTTDGARFAVAIFVKSSRLPQEGRERVIAQAARAAVSP
jgi:beta-lactamase class A